MALVYKKIEQHLSMSLHDIIKFQLLNYCFINNKHYSLNQIETLCFLAEYGETNISEFCDIISDKEIYRSSQTVRNFILDCVKENIVNRNGRGDKIISISENLKILSEGNIFINLKVYTDAKS